MAAEMPNKSCCISSHAIGTPYGLTGADPGEGHITSFLNHIREAKTMMYWYKNVLFPELSVISLL